METIKVKIKTWGKMEEEFGLTEFSSSSIIDCDGYFVNSMENYLPEDRIIKVELTEDPNYYTWYVNNDDEWNISNDMIEEIIEE